MSGPANAGSTARAGVRAWGQRFSRILLFVPCELVWLLYVGVVAILLPWLARSRRAGRIPPGGCILCVSHVGSFDPLFVVRESRRWRMKAVFQVEDRYPFLGFLYHAVWRFRVTRDPQRRAILNPQTVAAVVRYLRRGGTVMVFPEGHRFWERKLYPGVAQIAHRSGAPIVPVGLENAYVYRPGAENDPLFRMLVRIVRETRRQGCVVVRFGAPILPDPTLPEGEDVDRTMRAVERWFAEFYRTCYGLKGPTWLSRPSSSAGTA